jgi:hypothetical protein
MLRSAASAISYSNGGALRVVTDADGQPREFADRDDAVSYTEAMTLSESNIIDRQIVVLDEL